MKRQVVLRSTIATTAIGYLPILFVRSLPGFYENLLLAFASDYLRIVIHFDWRNHMGTG